ncbi:PREDICTED: enhancer of mRNA-decapping protein 1-like [Acromyrmex echinatior]|nr:PREDICTED: enhancer of mRNA-decapping protein 1-like [Acromyrmex echinatior]
MTTIFDNSQSIGSNSVTQEITEEHKKPVVFKKVNNTARKIEKSLNLQKSNSKPKVLNENYSSPYNDNSQTNIYSNPNVSYVPPDNGNAYPYYPYIPGNFSITGEHNPGQIDHPLTSNVFYNLHLLHLEDTFRTLNPTYYGPIMYGPNHQSMQSLSTPSNAINNGPCMQYMREEVDRLVNDMQNSSLNEGSNASAEIPNASHVNMNNMQSTNQSKQGSRNLSGKDSSHPIQQKGKQTGTIKGNKIRNRQQNARGSSHMQYSGHQYGATMPSGSVNPYNARRHDVHMLQPQQHHWDPMSHQIAPSVVAGPTNGYAPSQYTTSNQIIPYHELPPHYTNESNSGNPSYYLGNGSYIPVSYLPPQHVDATENGAVPPSYPQHFYSTTEAYPPGHSSINGQPMIYSQPVMYPQSVQYHAVPSPSQHMQEQWNPTLGPQPSYVTQCIAPNPGLAPIIEPSPNGQCTVPKGSL